MKKKSNKGMYVNKYDKESDKSIDVCLNCKSEKCKNGTCLKVRAMKGVSEK